MIEHTEKCLAAREKERIELAEYEKRWPNYCHHCGGTGLVSWRENGAPHGSGESWPMEMSDSCPHCVKQGFCPRCGSGNTNFLSDCVIEGGEQIECFACGWKEGDPGAPEVESDCGCLEDSLEKIYPLLGLIFTHN